MDADLRVVLIHDWLTGMRGGEKVLESRCRRWPNVPLPALKDTTHVAAARKTLQLAQIAAE